MAKKTPPNPTDVFVGSRVRMARVLRNMTQEKLGEALGITFQQVQKYEKGTNRIGSSRMVKIAEVLQQPVSWFFDEQPAGKERNEGTDIVTRMLVLPGGKKLAESFVAIKTNSGRHALAEVAQQLAAVG